MSVGDASNDEQTRTVVGLEVTMENLRPALLPLELAGTPCATRAPVAACVVAMVESEEDLVEVVPNGVLCHRPVLLCGELDHGREVTAAAVLHEDVEDAGVAVYMAVVVADNVAMVEVFENVAARR
jgi:hypothetical protein